MLWCMAVVITRLGADELPGFVGHQQVLWLLAGFRPGRAAFLQRVEEVMADEGIGVGAVDPGAGIPFRRRRLVDAFDDADSRRFRAVGHRGVAGKSGSW